MQIKANITAYKIAQKRPILKIYESGLVNATSRGTNNA